MKHALIVFALLAAVPAHAATYFIDIVRPITVPGFTGPSPDFVQGTITTDCNNCVIAPNDIVDWNLIITTLVGTPAALLGPVSGNNSYVNLGGTPLVATPLGLFMNFAQGNLSFTGPTERGFATVQFFQASDFQLIVGWANGDGGSAFINPTSDLIGTAVPEPSTWALLLLGFVMLAIMTRRGMGPCAAREPTADGRKQQPVPAWSCGHG